jgi:hypothetical protein
MATPAVFCWAATQAIDDASIAAAANKAIRMCVLEFIVPPSKNLNGSGLYPDSEG